MLTQKTKEKEKEKNKELFLFFYLSLFTSICCICWLFASAKRQMGTKVQNIFGLQILLRCQKNTQEVSTGSRSILPQYSKLKHAAKMSSDEKNKESCIVLIVTLSGIIQREEVHGQHTEKLQTTSLQSTLKRCTSFKIHYSPITNVKSIYSCSMLVQKAYNTAWRAFFFFFTICYSLQSEKMDSKHPDKDHMFN